MGWQPMIHALVLRIISTNSDGLPTHGASTCSILDTHF